MIRKTVRLEAAINCDGQTYTELTFAHKTRMRDIAAMSSHATPLEKQVALMASLAGVPFEVMLDATEVDMANAALAVADLMGE